MRQLVNPFRFCSYLVLAGVLCWALPKAAAQSALFARGYKVILLPQKAAFKGGDFEDVEGHLPMRTGDMSYLIYRELILSLGKRYRKVLAVRNEYARGERPGGTSRKV